MRNSPCDKGRVVIVGGLRVRAREDAVASMVGCAVDHVEVYRNNTAGLDPLVGRIRSGRVALVIMLQGLMGHKHTGKLVDAARASGTPLVYGGKGGVGEVRRALEEAERQLAG